MFVVIATLVQVYILTTICSKYANWILRNGPLMITVDFLNLKLYFKFPFYLIHSHYYADTGYMKKNGSEFKLIYLRFFFLDQEDDKASEEKAPAKDN